MIKQVALLSVREGMSREAFIDRYENGHVPLVLETVPYFTDYRRSFVRHDAMLTVPSMSGSTAGLGFDVITEMRFADRGQVDALAADIADPEIGRRIAEDEAALFDRSRMIMFEADEHITPGALLKPAGEKAGSGVKMVSFLRKKPEIDRDAFIDRYENHNVPRALDVLRPKGEMVIAGYSRVYPRPDGLFVMSHVADPLETVEFDVMTEFWFHSQADFAAFLDVQSDPAVKERLRDPTDDLFDRTQSRFCLVDEFVCPAADLERAIAARLGRQ